MRYLSTVGGRTFEITIEGEKVLVEGQEHVAQLRMLDGGPVCLLMVDGRTWTFAMQDSGHGAWTVVSNGEVRDVEVLDDRTAHLQSLAVVGSAPAGPVVLKAPMPGLVVRVLVEKGQKVVEGTSLIILEAMKMQNELKAASSGIVERVEAQPGRVVEKGEVLLSFRTAGG